MSPVSFLNYTRSESMDWFRYAQLAWNHSSRSNLLDPARLYDDPIRYSENVYSWVERKYQAEFRRTFDYVDSALAESFATEKFLEIWNAYFDPWSLWKQLRPLFVFFSALGGMPDEATQIAAAYVVAQGVPSAAVDKLLDAPGDATMRKYREELAPFCLVAYSAGLEMMRGPGIPGRVTDDFLYYTRLMYGYMWKEAAARYRWPTQKSDDLLSDYVSGDSRLLSSVFYSITIAWAFSLIGREFGELGKKACVSLRKVRQLNDEIIDAEEDFRNGILTYPILHALADKSCHGRMDLVLAEAWHADRKPGEISDEMVNRFRDVLLDAGSFPATAEASLGELLKAASFIMDTFDVKDAFDISLILNQRLSTLVKRANNGWLHVPDRYIARSLYPPLEG